jgi:catechol 2,3-dioxygenase-like lactoylglutathione lyase family enzyme
LREAIAETDAPLQRETAVTLLAINHVQVAIPRGAEDEARRFYRDLLGLHEIPKPAPLAARGGLWFELGAVQLHLGADPDFRPAQKAHVAFETDGFDDLLATCAAAGFPTRTDVAIAGRRRAMVNDPFGNRVELIEVASPA